MKDKNEETNLPCYRKVHLRKYYFRQEWDVNFKRLRKLAKRIRIMF